MCIRDRFKDVKDDSIVWMSHTNYIAQVPDGFEIAATTETCPVAAMENAGAKMYAVQFHPEVEHSQYGKELLRNFIYNVCGCQGLWTMENFIEEQTKAIREQVGGKKVLCAPVSYTHLQKDPITRFERYLEEDKVMLPDQMAQIKEAAYQSIEDAVEYAKNSPEPPVTAVLEDVYA